MYVMYILVISFNFDRFVNPEIQAFLSYNFLHENKERRSHPKKPLKNETVHPATTWTALNNDATAAAGDSPVTAIDH